MRPVRTITAIVFATAVVITGCTTHSTARPSTAAPAPTEPAATTPAPPATATNPAGTQPSTPPPTAPRPAPRPTTCRTTQLLLRTGQIEGAMGHRYITYGLHNRSALTCTMVGFPGVQLLDAHGSPLPAVVSHTYFDTGPARRILLVPGGWAFFTLEEGMIPYGSEPEPCPTVTLAITPPGQLQALTIPQGLAPCGGRVSVSPVRPTGNLDPIG